MSMHYFSTNRSSPHVSFRDAVLNGQPEDKGLYFPSEIPRLPDDWLRSLSTRSSEQTAFDVIRPYVAGEIPDDVLFTICSETVSFDFPLVHITDDISTLELFHGPTLAFKDVGARFMSRTQYFSRDNAGKDDCYCCDFGRYGRSCCSGFSWY